MSIGVGLEADIVEIIRFIASLLAMIILVGAILVALIVTPPFV